MLEKYTQYQGQKPCKRWHLPSAPWSRLQQPESASWWLGWFISGTVNYSHFHTNQSLAPRFGNLKTSALWTHRFSEAMRIPQWIRPIEIRLQDSFKGETLSMSVSCGEPSAFFFWHSSNFYLLFFCWKTAKKWKVFKKTWLLNLASLGRLMKDQVKMWGWRRGPVQHPFPRLKLPGSEPEATFLETLVSQVGDALGSYGSKKATRYIDRVYLVNQNPGKYMEECRQSGFRRHVDT